MESFKVVMILASVTSGLAETTDSKLYEKCFPPKNMCDLDTNSCMVADMDERVSDCDFVDGPGIVPKSQIPTKYWINISDEARDDYPPNLTYSVYRYKLRKREDEKAPHLNPIPGCCGLTLTDKNCVLPKHHEEEGLVAIAAIATAVTDKHWFCLWEIEEQNVYETYCDDENTKLPCVEFKDGFPRMRTRINPISVSGNFEQPDYCFFSAPANIATRVIKDGEIKFSHEKYFPTSRRASNCSLVSKKNGRPHELAKRHTDLPQEGAICYYSRLPNYYPAEWYDDIRCYIAQRENENDGNFKSITYLPVVIGAFVCLLLAIVVYSVGCRRRQDTIRKKLGKSVPSSVITATNEYFDDDRTSQNTSTTPDGSSQETFFSIEYEIVQQSDASAESEKVLSKDVLIEKSGHQWPNDVLPKDENGIYCQKFDTLSYIRIRQDVN